MPRYDAVVIGAGNGGLTSSLTLARKGLKVMLLERHNIPGGCGTSFMRGRFEFEVALHQLSGLGRESMPGPLRDLLGRLGIMEKLNFIEMKTMYRLVVLNQIDITLPAVRAETIGVLKERFPGESDNIDRFFDMLYAFCMEWVGAIVLHDPEASKAKYPTYCKYAFKPVRDVMDEYFQDPLLKAVVASYWGYLGLPPSRLSFSDLAIVIWAYLEYKPWHLHGGSQAMSSAILDEFMKAGGEVRFNCEAKKILVKDGQVTGVVTQDGDTLETDYVVSNAGTIKTMVDLVGPEATPAEHMKELGSQTIGTSGFTVYMGFDREPKDLGIHETTNFICTSIDAEAAFAAGKTLSVPQWMLLTAYDVDDPEFSPAGASQAALVALQYGEPWLNLPPSQYFETKYRIADGMLSIAEQVFPGLREHIEELEVATPLTHMRYLGHPAGAIYGQEQFAKDSTMFSEMRSHIRGLYCAGAWVGLGGFQPTLESGNAAAKAVLKAMHE